jgi:hypothetical protein
MALNIELLVPVLLAHPVECEVPECPHQHERLLNFSAFSTEDKMLHLCRKHYEDFSKSAHHLP